MGCLRAFVCYLLTMCFITTIFYAVMQTYLMPFHKIDSLEKDIKELFYELSQISGSKDSLGGMGAKGAGKPQGLGQNNDIESVVQRHVNPLKTELKEMKRMVEQAKGVSYSKGKKEKTEIMRADFALECLGGKVESVNDETYGGKNFINSLFGLGALSNEPRNVLDPSLQPGNCYAFKGNRSTLIIKLMGNVFVDSVGIEHISDSESPDGTVSSAPKDFSVYGMKKKNDENPFRFGSFTYDATKKVQIFNFEKLSTESYKYIKFQFESNHGHPNYTCVYRISVHGKLDKSKKEDGSDL